MIRTPCCNAHPFPLLLLQPYMRRAWGRARARLCRSYRNHCRRSPTADLGETLELAARHVVCFLIQGWTRMRSYMKPLHITHTHCITENTYSFSNLLYLFVRGILSKWDISFRDDVCKAFHTDTDLPKQHEKEQSETYLQRWNFVVNFNFNLCYYWFKQIFTSTKSATDPAEYAVSLEIIADGNIVPGLFIKKTSPAAPTL